MRQLNWDLLWSNIGINLLQFQEKIRESKHDRDLFHKGIDKVEIILTKGR